MAHRMTPIPDGWSMFRRGRAWFYRYRLTERRAEQTYQVEKIVTPKMMHACHINARHAIQEDVEAMMRSARCQ